MNNVKKKRIKKKYIWVYDTNLNFCLKKLQMFITCRKMRNFAVLKLILATKSTILNKMEPF